MKLKLTTLFLLVVFEGLLTSAKAQVMFQKMYGGNTALNSGTCHQQTFDGGYILAGHTIAFGSGNFDLWLIKVELDGDLEWTKTYGGFYSDGVQYIQQTSDSGYIILGTTQSFGSDQMLLIKTDHLGNIAWSRSYGGAAADIPNIVKQTIDGGVYFGWKYCIVWTRKSRFIPDQN